MSLLIDSLPDTVKIGGKAVPIDTDFRTSIRYELLLTKQLDQLSENDLLLKILSLFFPNDIEYVTENLQETIDALMWFYRCGEPESEDTGKRLGKSIHTNMMRRTFTLPSLLSMGSILI